MEKDNNQTIGTGFTAEHSDIVRQIPAMEMYLPICPQSTLNGTGPSVQDVERL